MDIVKVLQASTKAIAEFNAQSSVDLNDPALKSILAQLQFIQDCSSRGINPISELKDGKTFTFGIISSREFASPDEMVLKEFLNEVDFALYHT